MKKNRPTPEVCPVYGEDVPPKAQACPNCGACHESGWNEDADPDIAGTDITGHGYEDEEKFDYERWQAREQGRDLPRHGVRPMWKWVALLLLVVLFWAFWKWIYRFGTTSWF